MNMKSTVAVGATLAIAAAFAATPQIDQENVSLSQGVSRLITINYTLADAPGIVTADIQTNRGDGVYCSIGGQYLRNMYGDVNAYQQTGAHQIHWQPDQAWPNHKLSIVDGGVRAVVTAWATNCPPDYMALDIDPAAPNGNVRFYADVESIPFSITNWLYRTDVLVMRKVPAAGIRWRMGSPSTESGRTSNDETPRYVTLTKDYYIGVFMLTQRQYKQVMGALPNGCSFTDSDDSPICAVNTVGPTLLRGKCKAGETYDWPNTTPMHKVDPNSVCGKLRTKSNGAIEFDLPTSAQWEYACRAGTFTAYNNGTETNVTEVGWCRLNCYRNPDGSVDKTRIHATGLLKPNAWGIYDMHGLHYEPCLDWYNHVLSTEDEIDPVGPSTGSSRVARGGTYRGDTADTDAADKVAQTRSAAVYSQGPEYYHGRYGARLCAPAVYFAPAE